MAKRYLINIFLLIAVLCGFSSCEEDPYYDPYEEITYDLCNYVWTDWFVVDGLDCEQQLTFNPDGKGWERMGYKNLSLPKRTHRSRGNSILLGLGQLLYRYTLYGL